MAAGDVIRVIPPGNNRVGDDLESRLRLFDHATERHRRVHRCGSRTRLGREVGPDRICTSVAALIDTNILVYRFDSRFPEKRKIATEILRRGIAEDSVRVPHQAIVEFVAAVTRPIRGHIFSSNWMLCEKRRKFLKQFTLLYPNESILRDAIRACAAYQLNWFDAHLWAYAEHYGLSEIFTEDLQHDRLMAPFAW